ncbi:MAG: 23S rRNA (uracil(1939)-C(5))-methyltransferase RlmD [Bacteroidales bacterium]|nr:23S rRNA (uracil(1939)-C(5))-methyltransferase RlmD [Bacteroidales bacterium]MCM1414709.1 23S rRNA (uracil(1939)-C(5))-methyltransferase RlmD [bacterium]MCM1422518.1 23S rRNA (uracil(1939)-C(5))-methyltransferase RlmD [bacterium]
MEYQKNDIVAVTIEDMGINGEGIGRADGYTLFIKDAVIGDVVEARITKCKKNYGYAKVEKVVTPSPFRVEPKCPFHRQCGGCQIQAMQYEKQLAYKENKVRSHLQRIGGFSPEQIDAVMEPIVGMEEPWHYRNKAQYPVGYDRDGKLVAGFYAGRTHTIIANTDCPLGPPENQAILEAVLAYMKENDVSAYRETTGEGLVRHVLIRTGFATGEIMVCLVINGKRLPAEERLVEKLTGLRLEEENFGGTAADRGEQIAKPRKEKALCKRIASIAVSINTENTNVIMGKEIRVLWGSGQIRDSLRVLELQDFDDDARRENCESITFSISPLSFYQVNPRQTEKLYGLALEYAGLTGEETVWDLYCGIGTISLFMAKRAKKVCGVEIVPQAIEDARENARRNCITNAEFFVGKAEEVLPAFYHGNGKLAGSETGEGSSKESVEQDAGGKISENERMRHPEVIVVDPPRKGCDEKCLNTMLAMQPERIVYVSCDPATLARDLKVLCGGGYEIRRVRAVDQFGHTGHVEAVCLLSNI